MQLKTIVFSQKKLRESMHPSKHLSLRGAETQRFNKEDANTGLSVAAYWRFVASFG